MRKIIISTLLLLLAAIPVFSAEKYAVLITGCYANTHIPSELTTNSQYEKTTDSIGTTAAWNDTYLQWEQLMKKGYKNENIYVLFADGRDFPLTSSGSWVDNRYIPMIQMSIPSITDYQATKSNVETVFNNLKNTTTTDDFLFVWTFDHGALDLNTNNSFLGLLNPTLDTLIFMADTTFARLVNQVPANKKVIQMSQCYSGGFINDLENYSTIVHTSAENRRSAHNCDDIATPGGTEITGLENEIRGNGIGNNEKFWHSEFNFHNYNALAGETPVIGTTFYNGQSLGEADTNNDGVVSVEENKEWTRTHETQRENPQYSDLGDIGRETTLQYPTIFFQEAGGPVFKDQNMKGISAITTNAVIETLPLNQSIATLTIDNGGDCTVLAGKIITIGNPDAIKIGSMQVKKATLTMEAGVQIYINNLSSLNLTDATVYGGTINVKAGGFLKLSARTKLFGTTINVEDAGVLNVWDTPGYVNSPIIAAGSVLNIQRHGVVYIRNEAVLEVQGTMNVAPFANLQAMGNNPTGKIAVTGKLNINGTADGKVNITGFSQGIVGYKDLAEIKIDHANFSSMNPAVSGTGKELSLTNSTISNCANGLNLVSFSKYTISSSTLTGNNSGVGISVNLSGDRGGYISGNTLQSWNKGLVVISCAPTVANNTITNNVEHGIYVAGSNSIPDLMQHDFTSNLNNTIYNNGLNGSRNKAQIFLDVNARATLDYGYNNIYSNLTSGLPVATCVYNNNSGFSRTM